MADWSHETRRFIYRSSDPKWLRLKASARALAGELLRWVDDDGAIYSRSGEDPVATVFRVIQADRSEREWVRSATKILLEDKHLVTEADRITIRNFKVAQGIVESAEALSVKRSKEAEKKARQRAAKRAAEQSPDEPEDSGAPVPRDTPGHVPGTTRGHVPGTTRGHVPGDIERDNAGDTQARARTRVGAQASAGAPTGPFRSVPFPSLGETNTPRVPEPRPGEVPLRRLSPATLNTRARKVLAEVEAKARHLFPSLAAEVVAGAVFEMAGRVDDYPGVGAVPLAELVAEAVGSAETHAAKARFADDEQRLVAFKRAWGWELKRAADRARKLREEGREEAPSSSGPRRSFRDRSETDDMPEMLSGPRVGG